MERGDKIFLCRVIAMHSSRLRAKAQDGFSWMWALGSSKHRHKTEMMIGTACRTTSTTMR